MEDFLVSYTSWQCKRFPIIRLGYDSHVTEQHKRKLCSTMTSIFFLRINLISHGKIASCHLFCVSYNYFVFAREIFWTRCIKKMNYNRWCCILCACYINSNKDNCSFICFIIFAKRFAKYNFETKAEKICARGFNLNLITAYFFQNSQRLAKLNS
jgi:hypothetical protein